jgi:large subunit ribosomal protein L25
MSENLVTIEAEVRKESGKSYARKLRKTGKIPAVLLGKGASTPLELDPKWLHRAYEGEGKLLNLVLNGETKRVKIQEVQIDPIKRFPLHVDLLEA